MKKIIFFLLLLIFFMFSEFAQEKDRSRPAGNPDIHRQDAVFPATLHAEGPE